MGSSCQVASGVGGTWWSPIIDDCIHWTFIVNCDGAQKGAEIGAKSKVACEVEIFSNGI